MKTAKRESEREYIKREAARAAENLALHAIRERDARSWLCMRPHKDGGWDSAFWFEVIVLRGGELYVHGDISGVHFAHYGAGDPEKVLRWMGGRDYVCGYVSEKARIGMQLQDGGEGVLSTYDEAVFLNDALNVVQDLVETQVQIQPADIGNYKDKIPEWIFDAIEDVAGRGDLEEVRERLMEDGDTSFEMWNWGQVPSYRLIIAHEALRCLVRLLDAEQKPPA